MLSKAEIEARDAERSELAALMAEFEAKKGPIETTPNGVSANVPQVLLNPSATLYSQAANLRRKKEAEARKAAAPKPKPKPPKPAVDALLAELMDWHGIKTKPEAIRLLITHAHALGPQGSASIFAR